MSAVDGLEPASLWRHFEALTRTARPSRREGPASELVRAWAAALGFPLSQDQAGNLVIRVAATPGRERAPTLILQGHLDMVCERDPSSPNDAAEGRIALHRRGDWLQADGTTLGADDGIGIAAMMALAEDASLPHGPLELLMTTAEEVGLEGANRLDASLLTGTTLVNLDGMDAGTLTVGCAGSADTWLRVEGERSATAPDAVTLAVTASGGLGGHSGMEIHAGRSNAIKTVGGVLRDARGSVPLRLVSLDGGRSRNAIPRDAVAVVSIAAEAEARFVAAVESAGVRVRDAFASTDPSATVDVSRVGPTADAWSVEATDRLLEAVELVPSGPLAMSAAFSGHVETSTSLGEAITDSGTLTLHSLSRSSNDAAIAHVIEKLEAVARLIGGTLELERNYSGWQPEPGSSILAAAGTAYERLFGEAPRVSPVHAGLEPAVIGTKLPGLEMIAIGPEIEAPHSPDERVSIASVERLWRLLVAVVDDVSVSAGSRPVGSAERG